MPTESLTDTLPAADVPEVELLVTDRHELPYVSVSVTFLADGYRRLPPGATITMNGVPLPAKPLQKRGYWYQLQLPRADRYELQYQRSQGGAPVQLFIRPVPFQPSLPSSLSKREGFSVRYEGVPLPPTAEVVAFFSFEDASNPTANRGATVYGTAQGQVLNFPPAVLAKVPRGTGKLQVAITNQAAAEQIPGHVLVYSTSLTRPVVVKD